MLCARRGVRALAEPVMSTGGEQVLSRGDQPGPGIPPARGGWTWCGLRSLCGEWDRRVQRWPGPGWRVLWGISPVTGELRSGRSPPQLTSSGGVCERGPVLWIHPTLLPLRSQGAGRRLAGSTPRRPAPRPQEQFVARGTGHGRAHRCALGAPRLPGCPTASAELGVAPLVAFAGPSRDPRTLVYAPERWRSKAKGGHWRCWGRGTSSVGPPGWARQRLCHRPTAGGLAPRRCRCARVG